MAPAPQMRIGSAMVPLPPGAGPSRRAERPLAPSPAVRRGRLGGSAAGCDGPDVATVTPAARTSTGRRGRVAVTPGNEAQEALDHVLLGLPADRVIGRLVLLAKGPAAG